MILGGGIPLPLLPLVCLILTFALLCFALRCRYAARKDWVAECIRCRPSTHAKPWVVPLGVVKMVVMCHWVQSNLHMWWIQHLLVVSLACALSPVPLRDPTVAHHTLIQSGCVLASNSIFIAGSAGTIFNFYF